MYLNTTTHPFRLMKLREHGIMNAEVSRMYTKKPVCITNGQHFESVSFDDSFGACFLLACGFILAITFLLLEKVVKMVQLKV